MHSKSTVITVLDIFDSDSSFDEGYRADKIRLTGDEGLFLGDSSPSLGSVNKELFRGFTGETFPEFEVELILCISNVSLALFILIVNAKTTSNNFEIDEGIVWKIFSLSQSTTDWKSKSFWKISAEKTNFVICSEESCFFFALFGDAKFSSLSKIISKF